MTDTSGYLDYGDILAADIHAENLPLSTMATSALASGTVHSLKTWPGPFALVAGGKKPFEIRWNDRDFAEGDILCLREFDPIRDEYTGREEMRRVTCVLAGAEYEQFGLRHGYALLGMEPLPVPRLQQAVQDAQDVTLPRLRAWHTELAASAGTRAEGWRSSAADADKASKTQPSVGGERFRACLRSAELEAAFHANAAAMLAEAEGHLRDKLAREAAR